MIAPFAGDSVLCATSAKAAQTCLFPVASDEQAGQGPLCVFEGFCTACTEPCTHTKKKADYNAELTKEILDIVSRLQDFYSNPLIYLPFRLPSLAEKAKDSELSDLGKIYFRFCLRSFGDYTSQSLSALHDSDSEANCVIPSLRAAKQTQN